MPAKLISIWFFAIIFFAVAAPVKAYTSKPLTVRLANGLKIHYLHHAELPIISINVVVKNRAPNRFHDHPDLPRFTAQLLLRGCRNRSNSQINKTLRSLGTTIDVTVTNDVMTYSCMVLRWDFEAAFSLLTDLIRYPTFEAIELGHLKQEFQKKRKPRQFANIAFPRFKFNPGNATIDSVTRQDVINCYQHYFVPGQVEINLIGNLAVPGILTAMKKNLSFWTTPPASKRPRKGRGLPAFQFVALEPD